MVFLWGVAMVFLWGVATVFLWGVATVSLWGVAMAERELHKVVGCPGEEQLLVSIPRELWTPFTVTLYFHEAAHMGLCDGGGAQGGFNWTVFPTELHMKVGLL